MEFTIESKTSFLIHHMAQSALKSPIGFPLFWETGANPNQEWAQWFSTFKLAVMAKENLKVDKLLRTKPTPADLFYPAMPSLEEPRPNETKEELRKRDIRNQRRKVDWENECKTIEFRGPYVDRYPWDEADTKIKSLLYLPIGQEGTRQFHQNNPHTNIDTCSTYEFAHELAITFTKPRNTTYDRFQIINARQEPHESLETFYSRLRELGAKAAFGAVEQDLVKDFSIGKMNNTAIQMELLSEMRTPAQALNYALARERGQQNQKEILRGNNSNWNTTVAHLSARKTKPAILPTPQNTKQYPQCWRCGGSFTPNHNNNCPAKISQWNICKKQGHVAKMCRSQIPSLPKIRGQNQQRQFQKTRNVKNITEEEEETIAPPLEEEEDEETIDPEPTMYITELMEDWNKINLIERDFKETKNWDINNRTPRGEILIQTTINKTHKLDWLAETRSPRSFIDIKTANEILQNNNKMNMEPYNGQMKFKCFNNQDIPIIGQIHMELHSGSWTAKHCNILVVKHGSQQNEGKKILNINENIVEQNITKWIFKKYPHLCKRLGRSKNHIAKSTMKQEKTPTQHKGRRVPLHLVEKVENELQKLIEDKQIIRLEKCPDDLFISPVVITLKKDKSIKIALDSKELNKAIHKNKYQMQSIDHLTDSLAMQIASNKNN